MQSAQTPTNAAVRGSAALSPTITPCLASSVSMGECADGGRTKRGRPWQPPLYSPLTLTYTTSSLRTTLMWSQTKSTQPKVSHSPPLKVLRTARGTTPLNPTRNPPFGTMCSPGKSPPHHHHSGNNNNNHHGGRWTLEGGRPWTRSPLIGEGPRDWLEAWELPATRGVMLHPLGRQDSKDLDCLIVAADTGLLRLTCLLFDSEWF